MNDTFTVGELRRHLKSFPDNFKISFDGDVHFNRMKIIDDDELFIEWQEIHTELSPQFPKQHPTVKVAFCDTGYEGGEVEVISVPRL